MIAFLKSENGFIQDELCSECGVHCQCEEELDEELDEGRFSESKMLSPYVKAQATIAFHQKCVSNLQQHYNEDLSIIDSDFPDDSDHFLFMGSLSNTFPATQNMLYMFAEILLADSDLRADKPYWFEPSFLGQQHDPNTGSSFL